MTVGHELARRTGVKLFHNHMTIDLALNFFPFGHPQFGKLVGEFRRRIFEEVAASQLSGLIFTYVWALDDSGDKDFVDQSCDIFRQHGGSVYFVELEATQSERLERNRSAFRLAHKPSKRDIGQSEANLLATDARYKLNSTDDFFYHDRYVKINNTELSAADTAQRIIETFGFPRIEL